MPATATLPAGFTNSIAGTDPGFVGRVARDYHLTVASPALNAGVNSPTAVDGSGTTISATPQYEYVDLTTSFPRPVSGALDLGAYELATGLTITNASTTVTGTATSVAAFTVSLNPSHTSPVTVNYATADGTATAGADYQATSGSLTFAPGQTIATINVPVYGNPQGSPTKTFAVTLSSPGGAPLAVAAATGTIFEKNPTGSATFVGSDTTTQGNWKGTDGADGYNVIGAQAAYPAYAQVTPSSQGSWTWAASTTDCAGVAGPSRRSDRPGRRMLVRRMVERQPVYRRRQPDGRPVARAQPLHG